MISVIILLSPMEIRTENYKMKSFSFIEFDALLVMYHTTIGCMTLLVIISVFLVEQGTFYGKTKSFRYFKKNSLESSSSYFESIIAAALLQSLQHIGCTTHLRKQHDITLE